MLGHVRSGKAKVGPVQPGLFRFFLVRSVYFRLGQGKQVISGYVRLIQVRSGSFMLVQFSIGYVILGQGMTV
jgi:hypothetical protein